MPLLEVKFPAEFIDACRSIRGFGQLAEQFNRAALEAAWWDGARTGFFAAGLAVCVVGFFGMGNWRSSMNRNVALGIAALCLLCGYVLCEPARTPASCLCATRPDVCSCPDVCTCQVARPRVFETLLPVGAASVGSFTAPNGKEIQCHLDEKFHLKNRGGSDGAGLCVFASLKHGSIFQHVRQTDDIFEFMFSRPGGGYPSKVDKIISLLCESKNVEIPDYLQVESRDLEILKLACKTGRMPGVTYGFSPTGRYNGQRIAHMVSLCHADDDWFGILDNNYPRSIEWMDPATFLRVYTSGGGNGWSVIFLDPGPPPVPTN